MKLAERISPLLKNMLLVSPAILGVLLMAPRLADPQFGLFDDGQTITNATQVFQGNWGIIFENAYGRTRPIYWLFYTLIYKLAGRNPFGFFMVNLVLFVVTILLVIALVTSLGGTRKQAFCAGLIFTLCDPVIENVFTLSKAEMLQMALMMGAILCFTRLVRLSRPWKHWGLIGAIVVLTLAATLSKEVTLLGAAITCGWIAVAWGITVMARGKKTLAGTTPDAKKSYLPALMVFLGAQAAAGLVFLAIRLAATGTAVIQKTPTSYAANFDLSFAKLATNFIHWSGWLLHDFPYFAIIILFLAAWGLRRRGLPQPALILGSAIWMAAWFLFYLPWRFIVDYYLLPFAIGSSIVCGIVIGEAIDLAHTLPPVLRGFRWAGLFLASALFCVTLVNNWTNARIQLTIDNANAAMLNSVAQSAPKGSQVLLNLSPQSEYGDEIKMHLKLIELRPDLNVSFFSARTLEAARASQLPYLIISPELINQQILSVRMGISEPDVNQAKAALNGQPGVITLYMTRIQRQFHLFSIDLTRLMCAVLPGTSYCAKNYSIVDLRLFTYGWDLYETNRP